MFKNPTDEVVTQLNISHTVQSFLVLQNNRAPFQVTHTQRNKFASTPTLLYAPDGTQLSLPIPFAPTMSENQYLLLHKLLKTFADVMRIHLLGNRFMLDPEAVLGSIRHHDLVPWFDHAGVLVDKSVQSQVRHLLRNLDLEFLVVFDSNEDVLCTRLIEPKNHTRDLGKSRATLTATYGWPHIHIRYYEVNSTHVHVNHEIAWLHETIFPLYMRPFGKKWYPTARNPQEFLRAIYEVDDVCETASWSHITETPAPIFMVRCKQLADRYAFVERSIHQKQPTGEMVLSVERLVQGGLSNARKHIIHEVLLAVPREVARCELYTNKCQGLSEI